VKITEIFHSIEGEGVEIGRPEIFIRLTGCNLKCEWCDTKYAWKNGVEESVKDIVETVKGYPCKSVSITGGEPLCQSEEVLELVKQLKALRYWIQINTNGTIFDRDIFDLVDLITMDCKCPSSHMESDLRVLKKTKQSYDSRTQFKFVVSDKEDYEYAKKMVGRLVSSKVVIQPEWSNRKYVAKLVESVKKDRLCVRIILQQHKAIWGIKKGV